MANLQEFLDARRPADHARQRIGAAARGRPRPQACSAGEAGAVHAGVELRVKFVRPDHPLAYGYHDRDVGVPDGASGLRPCARVRSASSSCSGAPARRRRTGTPRRARTRPRRRTRTRPWRPSRASNDGRLGRRQEARRARGPSGDPRLPAGKGRVLAFNFNPMHRDLNHSDYRFVWNGILNWSGLPPAQP